MIEKQKTVLKVKDYVERHLQDQLKLENIAKDAGYTKYHLNRIFTEITGKSIHKYIQERRLAESAESLITTEKDITEIAQDAGYSTQQAYTLAFRNFSNYTPSVYRQLYRRCTEVKGLNNRITLRSINNRIFSSMHNRKGAMAA